MVQDEIQNDTAEKYSGLSVKSLNCSGPVAGGGGHESAPRQFLSVFLIKIAVSN